VDTRNSAILSLDGAEHNLNAIMMFRIDKYDISHIIFLY
jgi:hypothetical protein